MLECEFVTKNKTVIMPKPPGLTPADFFLFPKLKAPIKGKRFATIEEIKAKSQQKPLAVPKNAFQKCFENCRKCWHKCIIAGGVTLKGTR